MSSLELFVVKHYIDAPRPTIKGNGFDGLEVGEEREEAEDFIAWVNSKLTELIYAEANLERLQRQWATRPVDGER